MAKKDLKSVQTDLAALAQPLPSQHVEEVRQEQRSPVRAPRPEPKDEPARERPAREPEVQFSFSIRESLRKALQIEALKADMTMRGFVLAALKDKGLPVTDQEILDARRKE